jgi:tRNA pseudouridine55 synthase
VSLKPVPVRIDPLEAIELSPPMVRFRARCSKGTYMRSLARDLGRALGCGAHLAQLRRLAIGWLRVEDAVPWDEMKTQRGEELTALLWSVERVMATWSAVELAPEWAQKVKHGEDLPAEAFMADADLVFQEGSHVRLTSGAGEFLGIGKVYDGPGGWWIHPEQVWATVQGPAYLGGVPEAGEGSGPSKLSEG